MTERAKVIKIEAPVKKFRRSRKDWNGHCHEDECFNDGQPRECEAPDLCWPNNCCFREGTDRPLIARPTETVLLVPKSDLDGALSRIAELEALASRSEAPAAAGAAQAVDERRAFEDWFCDHGPEMGDDTNPFARSVFSDDYEVWSVNRQWVAWQARAALQASKPLTDREG